MLLFRGLDLMMLNATSVPVPESFQTIANGFIPEMGPNTGYHNPTLVLALLLVGVLFMLEFRRRADLAKHDMEVPPIGLSLLKVGLLGGGVLVFALLLASYKGVPVVGLIVAGLVVIYSFVMRKTVFGRHVYSVGGNSGAARLSGVNTKRVDFMVMVNMGMLAAVAGMVFTAYLNASNPKDGVGFELDAIAAVFIGGAAVAGGVGTVLGAIVGGLVMGVLNLGLANLSVDSNFIQIIKGLVLLLAVAFDVRSKIAGRPSFIGFMMNAITRNPATRPSAPATADMTPTLADRDTTRASSPSGLPTVPQDLPGDLDEMDRPGATVGATAQDRDQEAADPGSVEARK
jgi:putative multiple sugar transport system permease protein